MTEQEHCCWDIGIFTFYATRENGKGYWVSGRVGDRVILEEFYLKGAKGDIINYIHNWMIWYVNDLLLEVKAFRGRK